MQCLRLSCRLHPPAKGRPFSFNTVAVRSLSCLAGPLSNRARILQPQATFMLQLPQCRHKLLFVTKPRKFRPCYSKDGVSSDMVLIYENNMHRWYFWSQLIINGLGVPSYSLCIYRIAVSWHLQDFTITSPLLLALVYLGFYTLLVASVNTLSYQNIKRIYADKEGRNFTAITQDWKMSPVLIDFDVSQVARKDPGSLWGNFFGNLRIKNRSFLAVPSDFIQPFYYNLFMGYALQRPLDKVEDFDLKDLMKPRRKK